MGLVERIGAAWEAMTDDAGPQTLGLQASSATSTLSNPQPWLYSALAGAPSASGRVVTPDSAMRVATVYGCERVLAESVAQLPLKLMRVTRDGGAEPATDHPLFGILGGLWNDEVTTQDGVELGMNHCVLRGTAFTQVVRDQVGRPVELWPLQTDGVQMRRNEQGKLLYDYWPPTGGSRDTFEADEIWRTVGMTFNGVQGVSPLRFARESIGSALAMEEHGARLFVNGASVGTVLESPNDLTDNQIDHLKTQLEDYRGSRNAHKTIVLENGMHLTAGKLGMSNVDSQWVEARRFTLEEICRIFRVPPHKVQELARSTFNNIEHLSIDFVNSTLRPWLRRFELSGFRDLLLPNERKRYFLRFDVDSILQGDSQSQANTDSLLIAARVINPNEARRKRGMNPYEGGDAYENPNTTGTKQAGNVVPDTSKG